MVSVRFTQLDGKLPNVALMRLAHWHKAQGHDIHLARKPIPTLFEPEYDVVYGSAIFTWTSESPPKHPNSPSILDRLMAAYPDAIVSGTGVKLEVGDPPLPTVEGIVGGEYETQEYSLYPEFPHSIGFSQRGCRLKCGFCVVPKKEGKVKATNTIREIWRGEPHPKNILLLDNDFFGQPEWEEKIAEIREGDYRVAFSQGINIRMVTEEAAAALATIEYRDDGFKRRRLYTAWDNLKEESRFFVGLNRLNDAGIPSRHVMVYMLIGYKPGETMEEIMYRFQKLKDAGCMPYPMVFEQWRQPTLKRFQRWVVGRYHEIVSWEEFQKGQRKKLHKQAALV